MCSPLPSSRFAHSLVLSAERKNEMLCFTHPLPIFVCCADSYQRDRFGHPHPHPHPPAPPPPPPPPCPSNCTKTCKMDASPCANCTAVSQGTAFPLCFFCLSFCCVYSAFLSKALSFCCTFASVATVQIRVGGWCTDRIQGRCTR